MKSSKLTTTVATLLLCVMAFAAIGCQDNAGITGAGQNVNAVSQNEEISNVKTGLIGDLLGLVGKMLGQVLKIVGITGDILHLRTTSFEIPAGALLTPKTISYSLWSETPAPGLAYVARRLFKFSPDGTQFGKKCTLTVPFAELDLGNIDPRTLICFYYNETTRSYEAQETTVDLQNQRYIVKINHFSQYAFGRLQ